MTSSTGKHERGTCFPSLSDIFLGNRKQRVGTDVTAHDTSVATVHVSKRSINTYGMKLRNSFERAQDERDAEVNEWHLPEEWCLDFQMTPPVGSPAHGVKKPCDFFALTHAVILDSIPSCLETLVCPSRNFSYNHNPSYHSNRSSASHRHSLDEKIQNLVNESEKKSRSDPTSQKLVEQNLHVRDLDIDQDRDNKSQKSTYNSSSQKSKNSCDDDSQHEIEHEDLHENLEIQYENQQ